MRLTAQERRTMIRQGTLAALARAGAYTCPYIDDEERFSAWIEGYEIGERKLAGPEKEEIERSPDNFWFGLEPAARR